MDQSTKTDQVYDVLIVGGSVAGLSAALLLGRSLRNVLVIDSGKPCNRQTPHSHNFMTRDGETPANLATIAREQALAYPTVSFRSGKVTTIQKTDESFRLTTDDNNVLRARNVLLATGLEDCMPPIGGFAECWGQSVLHCPYCHGYEVKNQPLGILIDGNHTVDYVSFIQHWSQHLTFFTNESANLTDDQLTAIRRLNVPVVDTPIQRILHENGQLSAVELTNGDRITLTALFAPRPFRQHSDLAEQAGCTFTETGLIVVDSSGETSVSGLFAAGDNSSPMRQLAVASASGAATGANINRLLINEDRVNRLSH